LLISVINKKKRKRVGFCPRKCSGLGQDGAHSGERAQSCDPPTVRCS